MDADLAGRADSALPAVGVEDPDRGDRRGPPALPAPRPLYPPNRQKPIALTRMTNGIAGVAVRNPVPDGIPDGFDPQDPANASGLVVYLASDAASWLTGQVSGCTGTGCSGCAAGGRRGSTGASPAGPWSRESSGGLPEVYGTAPAGRLPDPAVHGA